MPLQSFDHRRSFDRDEHHRSSISGRKIFVSTFLRHRSFDALGRDARRSSAGHEHVDGKSSREQRIGRGKTTDFAVFQRIDDELQILQTVRSPCVFLCTWIFLLRRRSQMFGGKSMGLSEGSGQIFGPEEQSSSLLFFPLALTFVSSL